MTDIAVWLLKIVSEGKVERPQGYENLEVATRLTWIL
jgi:hypothetical protein